MHLRRKLFINAAHGKAEGTVAVVLWPNVGIVEDQAARVGVTRRSGGPEVAVRSLVHGSTRGTVHGAGIRYRKREGMEPSVSGAARALVSLSSNDAICITD